MSLVWTPCEKPAAPPSRGRVLPFITRWRAPLDEAQPEPPKPIDQAVDAPVVVTANKPIPITVRVRLRS